MRIHSDNLSAEDIYAAATRAGVGLYRMAPHGSRSRKRAFDVILEGSGRTGTRYGMNRDMIAATWDEWGIFLAEIFRRDAAAVVPKVYLSADHYHWVTGGRFRDLRVEDQHLRHKWEGYDRSITGAYAVRECKCGAVMRWELRAGAWEHEINDAMAY